MNIQAFSDLFKFESLAEQAHMLVRMRRVYEPEPGPVGPGLQRQNAMSYCDFREMKHMVESVLRKPRCAALLREWGAGAARRSVSVLIEEAQEIRKVLVENVMWRWWWQEMLSQAQAEVVCLMLFRTLGMPSEFCRRLIVSHNWMVAYFRPREEIDFPLNRLLNYGAADEMPYEFLGDARVASEIVDPENEADHQLALRVVRTLPLLRKRLSCWNPGAVSTSDNIAYFLNEEEADVERVCNWLALMV